MEIPKGKLILIGGNEAKSQEREDSEQKIDFENGILHEIIAEIRVPHPVIEVLPVASKDQEDMAERYKSAFGKLGLDIGVMIVSDKRKMDQEGYLKRLKKADALFITGGDQSRLKEMLSGTLFLKLLKEKYFHDNFVLAGTSAGAMIMSDFLIDLGEGEESLLKGNISLTDGFEFLPGTIIDTHFLKRGRFSRLTEALLLKRDCTGIGLCEDTALVVTAGDEIRAIGSGSITIIETYELRNTNYDDANEKDPVFVDNLRIHFLARGAKYFLKEKIFVVHGEKEAVMS